jgi:hypothetical protein
LQIAHDSPGMYDASAQRFHLSQRPREIIYREVRQGEEVRRTTSARVDPNRRNGGPRLPALTLSFRAALQGAPSKSPQTTQRTRVRRPGYRPGPTTTAPCTQHNARRRGASTLGTAAEGGLAGGVSALRDSVGTAQPLQRPQRTRLRDRLPARPRPRTRQPTQLRDRRGVQIAAAVAVTGHWGRFSLLFFLQRPIWRRALPLLVRGGRLWPMWCALASARKAADHLPAHAVIGVIGQARPGQVLGAGRRLLAAEQARLATGVRFARREHKHVGVHLGVQIYGV